MLYRFRRSRIQGTGFEVTSLDNVPKWKADIREDILEWDYTVFLPFYFNTVVCGVPCTEFSIAKTVGARDLELADSIVIKNPWKFWNIRSPKMVDGKLSTRVTQNQGVYARYPLNRCGLLPIQ